MADPNNAYGRSESVELSVNEELKYKKKCRDLKRRISEIEVHNEALVTKLARTKRYIQRVRLERAFLLEKLEEHTPRKLPGSDGSPSPPPSPSLEAFSIDALEGQSPVMNRDPDSPSQLRLDPYDGSLVAGTPRVSPAPVSTKKPKVPRDPLAPRRPRNPFLLFCEEERESVRAGIDYSTGETVDLAKEMGKVWAEMGDIQKQPYRDIYEEDKLRYAREMQAYDATKSQAKLEEETPKAEPVDGESPAATPAPKTGGFTAVNRG